MPKNHRMAPTRLRISFLWGGLSSTLSQVVSLHLGNPVKHAGGSNRSSEEGTAIEHIFKHPVGKYYHLDTGGSECLGTTGTDLSVVWRAQRGRCLPFLNIQCLKLLCTPNFLHETIQSCSLVSFILQWALLQSP